jgi:hypothetical protein
MVDNACGFTPEESARVDAERKAEIDGDTKRLLDVAAASLWWWRQNRPVGWALKRHQREYGVNCKGEAERTLAQACALLSLAGWPIRNPNIKPPKSAI